MDTKSVILENYLNTINLSAGTYGVQAAAQRYFGKNSEDLTLSECAVLAAIPQNPYAYNPIRFPEENAKRRKKVLTNMRNQDIFPKQNIRKRLLTTSMNGSRKQILPRKPLPRTLISLMN